MTREGFVGLVEEVVSEVGGVDRDKLAGHERDDLVTDLGLDSIDLMRVWVALEDRLQLPPGELGIAQVSSVHSIVERLVEAIRLEAGGRRPPCPDPLAESR